MHSEVQKREDPTKRTVSWVNELAVKEGALEWSGLTASQRRVLEGRLRRLTAQ